MKILVFGGTGFIGSSLIPFLRHRGFNVVVFSRNPNPSEHYWNPETHTLDPSLLENANGVINLAGENIFGKNTPDKQDRIRKSRLLAADVITKAICSLSSPPQFYIGASAIGYYGDKGSEPLTELSSPGNSFLSALCDQVEMIGNKLIEKNIRVIHARFGIVLGKNGGAFAKMEIPFQMGLGGVLGDGKHMVSFIALDDLLSAIAFVIENKALKGPINFTAPHPITNRQMTNALARTLKRPEIFSVPKWILRAIFGSTAEALLDSTAAYPKVLLDAGFIFHYPDIESTFRHIIADY